LKKKRLYKPRGGLKKGATTIITNNEKRQQRENKRRGGGRKEKLDRGKEEAIKRKGKGGRATKRPDVGNQG
jgi:hypothetical protein